MPGLIDTAAADRLEELMDERGLTAQGLALEIRIAVELAARSGAAPMATARGTVNACTIRRILDEGHVPTPRVKGVLANYLGRRPDDIWQPPRRARRSHKATRGDRDGVRAA